MKKSSNSLRLLAVGASILEIITGCSAGSNNDTDLVQQDSLTESLASDYLLKPIFTDGELRLIDIKSSATVAFIGCSDGVIWQDTAPGVPYLEFSLGPEVDELCADDLILPAEEQLLLDLLVTPLSDFGG